MIDDNRIQQVANKYVGHLDPKPSKNKNDKD